MLENHFKQVLTLAVKSAYLFLVYYEHTSVEYCPLQFKHKFYRRYVDNIFLLFDQKDHVKKFLKYMNTRHRYITFTVEEEQDNEMFFLNISITRVGNELQTSFFCKNTFSGVYLNFKSHLPNTYKKGLIDTLLYHAYNICSDYSSFETEMNYLKTVEKIICFCYFYQQICLKGSE